MKKLTAEVARRDISHLKAFQKQPNIGLSLREETYLQALEIALPILEQQERVIEQVKCPFPCGWKELLRVAMNDGAFLSQKLIEGEEVRDIHRHAALRNTDRLVRVITAILDAFEAVGHQEQGDGWIEWGGGECPVPPKTIVTVRYRKGKEESPGEAGGYFWNHGIGIRATVDIIAYRIIPEQPTNQNGEQ